jgi:hypothetical protein
MPLNGSKSKKSKNKRKGLDNKEWYVWLLKLDRLGIIIKKQ